VLGARKRAVVAGSRESDATDASSSHE
jgi:hypothetical protein